MKPRSITAIGSSLLLAAITFHAALAQTPPDAPARLVTRDELRACMHSESELVARRQAMDARGQHNRDEGDAIRAEAQQMAQEQQRIVEDNGPMDRFNRRVKAHNARVQAAKDNAQAFRTDLEALNKALVDHNGQCGRIAFKPEDKEAILKEREPAKQ